MKRLQPAWRHEVNFLPLINYFIFLNSRVQIYLAIYLLAGAVISQGDGSSPRCAEEFFAKFSSCRRHTDPCCTCPKCTVARPPLLPCLVLQRGWFIELLRCLNFYVIFFHVQCYKGNGVLNILLEPFAGPLNQRVQ